MQGAPYDVLSGPAGRRENRPVQSSFWKHLPSSPPQHAAYSTTHSPQGGAVAHISCVSHPRHHLTAGPGADFYQQQFD